MNETDRSPARTSRTTLHDEASMTPEVSFSEMVHTVDEGDTTPSAVAGEQPLHEAHTRQDSLTTGKKFILSPAMDRAVVIAELAAFAIAVIAALTSHRALAGVFLIVGIVLLVAQFIIKPVENENNDHPDDDHADHTDESSNNGSKRTMFGRYKPEHGV